MLYLMTRILALACLLIGCVFWLPLGGAEPAREAKAESSKPAALPAGAVLRLGDVPSLAEAGSSWVWSADGKTVALVPEDGVVVVRDLASGKERHRLSTEKGVTALKFSAEDKTLVSCTKKGRLQTWSLASGKPLREFEIGNVTIEDEGGVRAGHLVVSASGNVLAFVDPKGNTSLWNLDSGKVLGKLEKNDTWHLMDMGGVALSPDGKLLVAHTKRDPTLGVVALTLWDVDKLEKPKAELDVTGVMGLGVVTFSLDGKRIAVAGSAGVVLIDAANGKQQRLWRKAANTVAFAPDGKWLIAGHNRGMFPSRTSPVRLLEVETGKELVAFGDFRSGPEEFRFAADQKSLTIRGDNKAGNAREFSIWSLPDGKMVGKKGHNYAVQSLQWSADGKTVISGSADAVILWDAGTGQEKVQIRADGSLCAVSPDASLVATLDEGNELGHREKVLLWDVAGKKVRHALEAGKTEIVSLAFAPDGKTLATVGGAVLRNQFVPRAGQHRINIWDVKTGKALHTLRKQQAPVFLARLFSRRQHPRLGGPSEPAEPARAGQPR